MPKPYLHAHVAGVLFAGILVLGCSPVPEDSGGAGGTGAAGSGGSAGRGGTGGRGGSGTTSGGSGGAAGGNGGSSAGSGGAAGGSGGSTGGSSAGSGGSTGGSGGSTGGSGGAAGGSGGSVGGSGGSAGSGGAGGSGDAAAETGQGGSGPPPGGPYKVVLITGDTANLDDRSRLDMIAILMGMKATHNVVMEEVAANSVRAAAMMDKHLLIAGPNANYFGVTPEAALKSLPVPIMVSKDGNTRVFGLGTVGATDANQNRINIMMADHPLAAGLPAGLVTVLTTPNAQRIITFSGMGPGAIKIAASPVGTTSSIIAYEKGSDMGGGFMAPAKRVGFFWHRPAGPTPEGRKLFVAAIEWCLKP